ncbi:outer membrane protein assembly factor BamD [Sphingomonas sp. ASV193]|uniref:outer membrane protein assembly factor BamD n=1 Tax=Sphingomonas sp. ASV193 TaxID=3144405 RepID=UPI0032E89EF9
MSISSLRAPLRPLLITAIAIGLAACGGGKKPSDTAYIARDVNTLYSLAKETMDKGDYEKSGKLFDEVERQHPYSVWARRAQLMSAFSYYMAQQYPDAISSAQRFLTIHPGNENAPYASYIIAMSYYQQVADVTRDQKITQQAADAFGELVRRYPESRYAADARLKMDLLNDHLAGKEMEVGRYYERAGLWLAAATRFRTVIDQYQTSSHTPEALERLVESYLHLGMKEEAAKAAAVLAKNYPNTIWYKHSYDLVRKYAPMPQG